VVVLDEDKNVEKAVEVSEEEMNMLAFRQQTFQNIREKSELYNQKLSKH
jgi:hypothetical protein